MDILGHCDCKKCISICICSCHSIVSSVSAPIKIFVCFKKKNYFEKVKKEFFSFFYKQWLVDFGKLASASFSLRWLINSFSQVKTSAFE